MAEDKGGTSPIDKPPLCDEHVSVEGHASVEGHPSVDEHPSVEEQRHAVVWDLFFIQRLDVGQRARVAFLGLKAALEDTRAADVKSSAEANATREDEINLLRSYLRSVHRLNMNDFLRYCHQKLGKSSATSTPTSRPAPATLVPDDPRVTNPLGVLWSPGFQVCEKPWISPTSPFWCQICGAKDVDLALLFKAEPTPAIDNYWSHNAQPDSPCWPWSAGSAVENQLLVTDPVCCDACSSYCIALGLLETSKKAVITTSLPAVRYYLNREAYDLRLHKIFNGRIPKHLCNMVFLALLSHTWDQLDRQERKRGRTYRSRMMILLAMALIWDLVTTIAVTENGLPPQDTEQGVSVIPLRFYMWNALQATIGDDCTSPPSFVLYPMPAFNAALRVIRLCWLAELKNDYADFSLMLRSAVIRRYVYSQVEWVFTRRQAEHGAFDFQDVDDEDKIDEDEDIPNANPGTDTEPDPKSTSRSFKWVWLRVGAKVVHTGI